MVEPVREVYHRQPEFTDEVSKIEQPVLERVPQSLVDDTPAADPLMLVVEDSPASELVISEPEIQEPAAELVIEEPVVEAPEDEPEAELTVETPEPLILPVPEADEPTSSPLWLADPLPHLPALPVASASHPLASSAENPWLLSVEPLPVLLNEEPSRLNDALLESGLLDPAAEPASRPATTGLSPYVPPLALGGEIPDVINIEPELATEEVAKPKSGPLSEPMTSDRMAELLRALGGANAKELPAEPASAPLINEEVIAAVELPPVAEPEPAVVPKSEAPPESRRSWVELPEPRIIASVEPEPASEPSFAAEPAAEPSVPLVSAAALFASLAPASEPSSEPAAPEEADEASTVVPKSPVTTSLRPKLRPRPIVTVAHPNHPGRKNWLTWWK